MSPVYHTVGTAHTARRNRKMRQSRRKQTPTHKGSGNDAGALTKKWSVRPHPSHPVFTEDGQQQPHTTEKKKSFVRKHTCKRKERAASARASPSSVFTARRTILSQSIRAGKEDPALDAHTRTRRITRSGWFPSRCASQRRGWPQSRACSS